MCRFKVILPFPGKHLPKHASAWVGHEFQSDEDLAKTIRIQEGRAEGTPIFVVRPGAALTALEKAGKQEAANYWRRYRSAMIEFPFNICVEVSERNGKRR